VPVAGAVFYALFQLSTLTPTRVTAQSKQTHISMFVTGGRIEAQ